LVGPYRPVWLEQRSGTQLRSLKLVPFHDGSAAWARFFATTTAPPLRARLCVGNAELALEQRETAQGTELSGTLRIPDALHRIGMNGLYVRWARELAAHGVPSLRFDISGIGDSPALPGARDNQLYSLHAVIDVCAAVDFVGRTLPGHELCLVGLCSGAYAAYHSALADPRIRRLVLINPQTFLFNPGDSLQVDRKRAYKAARYYRRRFGQCDAWHRLARGDVNLVSGGRLMAQRARDVALLSARGFATRLGLIPPSHVTRELNSLADAKVKVAFVYSGDDPGLGVLSAELGAHRNECFRRPELSLDVIEGSDGPDHTFTPLWSQDDLTRVVIARVLELSQPGPRNAAPTPSDVYRNAAPAIG
jgi:hypothetical protein